jgi:diguanylate cyclase (GGDEF)-like protein
MLSPPNHRRVLLVGADAEVQRLFAQPALAGWDAVGIDSSMAAPLLKSTPCELLLATENHHRQVGLDGIEWLAQQQAMPILLVADLPADTVAQAYVRGASLWLPRHQVLEHPSLLAGALHRLAEWKEIQERHLTARRSLEECRRQVNRLVALLSRTGTLDEDNQWYTQRHMLERLHEEIARAQRHATPLSLALGEVRSLYGEELAQDWADLVDWTAARLARGKRRCDIIGQYGVDGFMLLMTHTPSVGGLTCCRRLQEYLEMSPEPGKGPRGPVQAYFGVAGFSPEAATVQRLLRVAEEHLEAARRNRRERVVGDEAPAN